MSPLLPNSADVVRLGGHAEGTGVLPAVQDYGDLLAVLLGENVVQQCSLAGSEVA